MLRMLALKVVSDSPHRYRCVGMATSNDKTILGEQVILEFEEDNYPSVVSVRAGYMGIIETNLSNVRVIMTAED